MIRQCAVHIRYSIFEGAFGVLVDVCFRLVPPAQKQPDSATPLCAGAESNRLIVPGKHFQGQLIEQGTFVPTGATDEVLHGFIITIGYPEAARLSQRYKAFFCLRYARVSSSLLGTVIGFVSFHGIIAILVLPMSVLFQYHNLKKAENTDGKTGVYIKVGKVGTKYYIRVKHDLEGVRRVDYCGDYLVLDTK